MKLQIRKNDPTQIWFLTSIWFEVIAKSKRGEYKTKHDSRTFGYYRGWSAAYTAVKKNHCNMHECLYNHLVMERIGEGIHSLAYDEQWFTWTGNRWTPCQKPEALKGFTNWALG